MSRWACTASSEWPPRAKKLSLGPMSATPRMRVQIAATRRSVSLGGRADGLRQPPRSGGGGRGQGATVDLAVRRQREGVEGDDLRRHHHLGQRDAKQRDQVRVGERTVERDIADEAGVERRVLAGDDHGLADAGDRLEGRLDLAELDAVAADLDLVVGAAEEVEPAVLPPANEVAGPVHPAGRRRRTGRRGTARRSGPDGASSRARPRRRR